MQQLPYNLLQPDTNTSLPPLPHQHRTFFDISGTATREVVFSQWYKYFLKPSEDHGLGTLFVETLLEIAGRPFELEHFSVKAEVQTVNDNFIDLVLTGFGSDAGKMVLIENKIFHGLHNDLQDYWNHAALQKQRLGVLLTLAPLNTSICGPFKNLLHVDWVDRVCSRAPWGNLTTEQRFHLEHFTQAVKNLSRYATMNEHVSFFVENTDLVNRAIACRVETERFVTRQMESAASLLSVDKDLDTRQVVLYPKAYKNEAVISVVFEKLFTPEQELRITVSLQRKNLDRVSELNAVFASAAKQQGFELNYNNAPGWHNYATIRYRLSPDKWKVLDKFVAEQVEAKFFPIAQIIGKYLHDNTPKTIA